MDDADDLERVIREVERRLLEAQQLDHLSERRPIGNPGANEALVDERDSLRRFDVGVGEQASGSEPDADRSGVVGADLVGLHRIGDSGADR